MSGLYAHDLCATVWLDGPSCLRAGQNSRPPFLRFPTGCYRVARFPRLAFGSHGRIRAHDPGQREDAAQLHRQQQMAEITIYHNPACGTSRNTLALIRNSGAEPEIIEYLKTPPSRERLRGLIAAMGISTRELLRQKGTPYDELGLGEARWSDAELVECMLEHPILINRPIVVTPLGTRLCRPSEAVLDILPAPQRGPFVKEDGAAVVGVDGKRV